MSSPAELRERPWADASRPAGDRVDALLGVTTIEEKVAQLSNVSGEGCDAQDLELRGTQSRILDALLDTRRPAAA